MFFQFLLYLSLAVIVYLCVSELNIVNDKNLLNGLVIFLALLVIINFVMLQTGFFRERMNDLKNLELSRVPLSHNSDVRPHELEEEDVDVDEDEEVGERVVPEEEIRNVLNIQKQNDTMPGYYLANDGEYTKDGISYDKASDLICQSKLNDLYQQQNFNIQWSPDTHIGKSRGPLDWQKTN